MISPKPAPVGPGEEKDHYPPKDFSDLTVPNRRLPRNGLLFKGNIGPGISAGAAFNINNFTNFMRYVAVPAPNARSNPRLRQNR
jgi:hypothetical protein